MPPKPKLHKSSGKSGINHNAEPSTSNTTANSTLDPEIEQQFEIELLWCIQQLESSLKSRKLNPKQVQETTKTLNGLMSKSAPLIKKRQLMRVNFGDYRAKMAAEEKKLSKVGQNMKIATVPPSKKSVFVKKSLFTTTCNDFQFNFDINDVAYDISKVDITTVSKESTKPQENFHFCQSNNTFRFNFPTSDNKEEDS